MNKCQIAYFSGVLKGYLNLASKMGIVVRGSGRSWLSYFGYGGSRSTLSTLGVIAAACKTISANPVNRSYPSHWIGLVKYKFAFAAADDFRIPWIDSPKRFACSHNSR
jgi:hypothetical protein